MVEVTMRHLSLRNLDQYVHLFRARQVSAQTHSALIKHCYNLELCNGTMASFIKNLARISREDQRCKSSE